MLEGGTCECCLGTVGLAVQVKLVLDKLSSICAPFIRQACPLEPMADLWFQASRSLLGFSWTRGVRVIFPTRSHFVARQGGGAT